MLVLKTNLARGEAAIGGGRLRSEKVGRSDYRKSDNVYLRPTYRAQIVPIFKDTRTKTTAAGVYCYKPRSLYIVISTLLY